MPNELLLLLLLLFLTFSVLVANPKKLLYTVANPARGLLNREKRTKEKVWQWRTIKLLVIFDRPRAPWRLKVRLLRTEAMEALLYGCMTWAPRREHYRLLRRTHHRLLLRVIGYRRERGTYRQLSYAQALKKTGCQSVEATI